MYLLSRYIKLAAEEPLLGEDDLGGLCQETTKMTVALGALRDRVSAKFLVDRA